MQNLLTEKSIEKNIEKPTKPLTVSEIEQFYIQGMNSNNKIGLEYERVALDKKTLLSADYTKNAKIIEHFSSISGWELIYDNDTIIGASDNQGTTISLEPGMQLEISLAPKQDILEIDIELTKIIELLDKIAAIYDVMFIGYGITPKSKTDEILLLNKRRYKIMNEYLPYCNNADLCTKMMRKTAGIQINIDYKNKKDAYNKLKFFNLIMPFISGLCANSPIEDDKLGEYKTQRSRIWRHTGSDRCNLFYRNIFSKKFFKYKNVFKNYIEAILDVPMVFIEREGEYIPLKGKITFRDFMKSGYKGYSARYEDYITHQSLCFPDVRLKNYIEIRNHDSNTPSFALSLCALYKGLCAYKTDDLLKEFEFLNFEDIEKYYINSSRYGLDFKVNSLEGWNIAKKIFALSKKHLNSKERSYLEPLLNILKKQKTTADILIDNNIETALDLAMFI